jgi:hypothetical protein
VLFAEDTTKSVCLGMICILAEMQNIYSPFYASMKLTSPNCCA